MNSDALILLRKSRKLRQIELAKLLGISRSYLTYVENSSRGVTLDLLDKYATVMALEVSSIVMLSEWLVADERPHDVDDWRGVDDIAAIFDNRDILWLLHI